MSHLVAPCDGAGAVGELALQSMYTGTFSCDVFMLL